MQQAIVAAISVQILATTITLAVATMRRRGRTVLASLWYLEIGIWLFVVNTDVLGMLSMRQLAAGGMALAAAFVFTSIALFLHVQRH